MQTDHPFYIYIMPKCYNCLQHNSANTLSCPKCNTLLPIENQDYFSIFGLSRGINIDMETLENNFFEKIRLCHPDKFINKSQQETDIAISNTALLNKAYKTLIKRVNRARYILSLKGFNIDEESRIPQEFLLEAMEWREHLEAIDTVAECSKLSDKISALQEQTEFQLLQNITEKQFEAAHNQSIILNFISRFKNEVNQKLKDLL